MYIQKGYRLEAVHSFSFPKNGSGDHHHFMLVHIVQAQGHLQQGNEKEGAGGLRSSA